MSVYKPKRLSNPDIVRTIAPERLVELLSPHREYLRDRGLLLPSAWQSSGLDLDQLSAILFTSNEKTPKQLLDAIYYIDELATPAGMDALLGAARRAGMPFDASANHSAADVAVQVWLFSPAIVEQQHASVKWKMPRRFECFQSTSPVEKKPLPITAERIARAERELNVWLATKNRGRGARLFFHNVDGAMVCSVRRGDPFRRVEAITDDGVDHYHFRPAKYDTVIFNYDDQELRINTTLKTAPSIYCRIFGVLLFDDPNHFQNVAVYSFAPLMDMGEGALAFEDIAEIESVALIAIREDRGGPFRSYAIFGADDFFADLKYRNKEFEISGTLVDVSFRIKYRSAKTSRVIKLYAGNAAAYTRDENSDVAEKWMLLRRFVMKSGARPESRNDKSVASV